MSLLKEFAFPAEKDFSLTLSPSSNNEYVAVLKNLTDNEYIIYSDNSVIDLYIVNTKNSQSPAFAFPIKKRLVFNKKTDITQSLKLDYLGNSLNDIKYVYAQAEFYVQDPITNQERKYCIISNKLF